MSSIPADWLCPITLTLMTDPVIGSDGHTYERTAITEWLSFNPYSPMTRGSMHISSLRPNIALRNTIEAHLAAAGPAPTTINIKTPVFRNSPITATMKTITKDGAPVCHIRLTPSVSATHGRQGTVMIAILDNSGSMGEPASMGDGTETFGFTRLDLVKHAVRTMAATLNENDSLAIVTFSTAARVIMPPTSMDDDGTMRVVTALNSIHPDANTNIWDGIRQAAQLANNPELTGRNIVALLLTDGFPNVNPPRGILQTLKTRLQMTNPWTLHTFGFGYNLDSVLLSEIARWGRGLFGFIPDCSMVGTVFINFLANMLSIVSINTKIKYTLEGPGGTADTELEVGPIMSNQHRDIFIPERPSSLTYEGTPLEPVTHTDDGPTEFYAAYLDVIVNALHKAKNGRMSEAQGDLTRFYGTHSATASSAVKDMLRDIQSTDPSEGQIGMAPTYFAKWGEHYMRSYLRAQELQQCMNFKDPGLQIYGGDLFHSIQDEADRLFVTLPPPTPSGRPQAAPTYSGAGAGTGSTGSAALTSMSVFHNASNGCFSGDCKVRMADDSRKMIRTVQAGELVWTPNGPAKVRMVVICNSKARSQPMTQINGLCITPWHPIRWAGRWEFPASVASYGDRLIQTVYNFVLDAHHIVDVEGVECCTLAHGFMEPVVRHAYFGSQRIIDDLMKQPGAEYGRPFYHNLQCVRDPDTGMITGWIDQP
jgi:hypothetical protein